MKPLLLLFILFPAILFGQTRRKVIADSIKAAATNLQGVSTLISNSRGTWVEDIHITDTGEYITMVVRVHVNEAMAVLPVLPVVQITNSDWGADVMSQVTDLPLPPYIAADMATTLPVHMILAGDHPIAVMRMATVPPLPYVAPEPTLLTALALTQFSVGVGKANTLAFLPIPYVALEITEAIPLSPSVVIRIENRRASSMNTVEVPDFEQKRLPVTGMHLSEVGYSLLEKLEGFSGKLYSLKDGGFTIGFGFFIPYGELGNWSKGVTWEDAERMIRQKVPTYENQVKQYINVPLTQNEFDALTLLAYNLGGFSKATSIVNDVNRQIDFETLQHDWKRFIHSKAPGVARGLMNRRNDELGVRNEADYQPERKIQVFKK